MKIFLLGFMGTGKTYWGKKWAEQHGLAFYDLDTCIEETAGITIPEIFSLYGEEGFRDLERQALHRFENEACFILSTGGGTPCFFDNMDWMKQQGTTVYLETPVDILKKRLMDEKKHRPLVRDLSGDEIGQFITNKLAERNAWYRRADVILNTESISDSTFTQIQSNDV
ncbi:MAG: shikimate kinase [Chitinophagaceae bacterium]|nr:shikimate kinase [Chitinophagaceae bacterium]MCW5926465.1 shikimate kinase [Chitinophagaceae bacterium]